MNLDTKRERERESYSKPRTKIVLALMLALSLCMCSFAASILYLYSVNPTIEKYIDNQQISKLYDFYDQKVGLNTTAVYFIGSSIIAGGVAPPLIHKNLTSQGYGNITTYNLGFNGDTPLQRSVQIQKIIDSKPSLIIFGLTYRSFADKRFVEEFIVLPHDRLQVRNDSLYLYSKDEIDLFDTVPDIFYTKKYLWSALNANLDQNNSINGYLNEYDVEEYLRSHSMGKDNTTPNIQEVIRQANDPNDLWRPVITNEHNRYKEAILYNVKTLQNAGIPCVIINMPLHPITSAKITDNTRNNYFTLLNDTGASIYDLEHIFENDDFTDSHHISWKGAVKIEPYFTQIILQELNK